MPDPADGRHLQACPACSNPIWFSRAAHPSFPIAVSSFGGFCRWAADRAGVVPQAAASETLSNFRIASLP
jgi:hypothetical protein